MAIDVAYLRQRFPGIFPVSSAWDDVLDAAIHEAEDLLDPEAWGKRLDTAVLYKAASLAQDSQLYRVQGASSVSVGPVSMTTSPSLIGQANRFEQMYQALLRSTIPGVGVGL